LRPIAPRSLDGREGRKSLQLVEAIYAAAREEAPDISRRELKYREAEPTI
jgi:hypothetical protein